MARHDAPSKVSLDAHADQKLAEMRNMRARLSLLGPDSASILPLADKMAGALREQFPDTPNLGRVAVAVLVSMDSLRAAFEMKGSPLDFAEVSVLIGLAAEKLESEGPDRG